MSSSDDNKPRKVPKKGATKMSVAEMSSAAISMALKNMDKHLARQVVISAVGLNLKNFTSVFSVACELMWVRDLLTCLDKPEELRRAGYSARDVCHLVTGRGYFIDKEIRHKAEEIDVLYNLEPHIEEAAGFDFGSNLDKEKANH